MISLKRNKHGKFIPANGKKILQQYIYTPQQKNDFRISRGKFENFLKCRRCFYSDVVLGIVQPGMPGWSLNTLTDTLLKKEFDKARDNQVPHNIFIENGYSHIIPFNHKDLNLWRNSLNGGLRWKKGNINFTGGIDDLGYDQNTDEIVVIEYKSQAKNELITKENYLNDIYHESYKVQLDFYTFLLRKMGFKVANKAFFVVVNAIEKNKFDSKLHFDQYLFDYNTSTDWIEEKIIELLNIINSYEFPESNLSCENCARDKATVEEYVERDEELKTKIIEDFGYDNQVFEEIWEREL